MEVIYTFNGKDITMNVLIQIRAVIKIIQKKLKLSFEDAMGLFYNSKTYEILQNTEKLFGRNQQSILLTDTLRKRNNNIFSIKIESLE